MRDIITAIVLAPLSFIYLMIVQIRHALFNCGILSSQHFDIPIICVGNITVGGSGKTPMCELLIETLSQQKRVALLSRGYGRKSRGYIEVTCDAEYSQVGDEPLQMKRKFPEALVVVCEKRAIAIKRILEDHPDVGIIIMDDGFQHRYVEPWIKIIMVDATQPITKDKMLPWGRLRDSRSALHRGDIFVVTKCSKELSTQQRHQLLSALNLSKQKSSYYTSIENLDLRPLYPTNQPSTLEPKEVIALAGIGNPAPFTKMLNERYTLVDELIFGDHKSYTSQDTNAIIESMRRHPEGSVIMTEKDSVKFIHADTFPATLRDRLYYSPIKMHFLEGSEQELIEDVKHRIDNYVREN